MNVTRLLSKLFGLLLIAGLVNMLSCGSEGDTVVVSDDAGAEQEEQGTFQISPSIIVNNNVINYVKATSRVDIEGDEIIARVEVKNATKNVVHKQYIYAGRRCPTLDDDQNSDGYLDWEEVQHAAGPILIPLDNNLLLQDEGGYPRADDRGNYTYIRRGSLTSIIAELRAPDEDEADGYGKLPLGEDLNINGRVIIIHGVHQGVNFPASVKGAPNDSVYASLPICCGVIEKADDTTPSSSRTTGNGTSGRTSGRTSGGSTGYGRTSGGTTGNVTTGSETTSDETTHDETSEDETSSENENESNWRTTGGNING